MLRSTLLLVLTLAASPVAFGQTRCPGGATAGSAQCLPDDAASAPARPTGEWIKTWGAIVNSDQSDRAWASVGLLSQKEAEDDGIDQCRSAGVGGCKVSFTYRNQCVALASSSTARKSSGMAAAPDVAQAEASALSLCEKKNGASCTVIYKDCTKPVFRKY